MSHEYDCVKAGEYGRDMEEIDYRFRRLEAEIEPGVPYFLVGLTADNPYRRVYIASFSTMEKLSEFVRSCRRRKDNEFLQRSPLGGFMDYEIVRFYAPDLPKDPQPYGVQRG